MPGKASQNRRARRIRKIGSHRQRELSKPSLFGKVEKVPLLDRRLKRQRAPPMSRETRIPLAECKGFKARVPLAQKAEQRLGDRAFARSDFKKSFAVLLPGQIDRRFGDLVRD